MSFKLELSNSKETIHDTLGISDERQNEIKTIIIEAWTREKFVTDAMESIASQCNTINELALGMLGIGQLMRVLAEKRSDCK